MQACEGQPLLRQIGLNQPLELRQGQADEIGGQLLTPDLEQEGGHRSPASAADFMKRSGVESRGPAAVTHSLGSGDSPCAGLRPGP